MIYPTLNIAESANAIARGKVLAYPTEAVWGLGCDPFNVTAVAKLLALKQRPVAKGLIVLAASTDQLIPYVDLQPDDLMALFDPHQTTTFLVPYYKTTVPTWIAGEHALLAVRISRHPTVKALCEATQGLLVSTSANIAGAQPARDIFQVRRYFNNQVDICQGRIGGDKNPSRIINFMTGETIRA